MPYTSKFYTLGNQTKYVWFSLNKETGEVIFKWALHPTRLDHAKEIKMKFDIVGKNPDDHDDRAIIMNFIEMEIKG